MICSIKLKDQEAEIIWGNRSTVSHVNCIDNIRRKNMADQENNSRSDQHFIWTIISTCKCLYLFANPGTTGPAGQ